MGGFIGAVVSTIAMCLPSFVIIYLISLFFDAFLQLEIVANAFRGIRVCVVFLILSAGWKMLKGIHKDPLSIVILSMTILLMIIFSICSVNFSTIFFILIAGLAGLTALLLRKHGKEAGKE